MTQVFSALADEYTHLLAAMKVARLSDVNAAVSRLMARRSRYETVSRQTGVPIIWLLAVDERESGGDPRTYFGNGDPLDRPTRDVPRGRGPFTTWEEGAIDALNYDKISHLTDWDWPRLCYEAELWNGFGYRSHGIRSPYLWAGTNLQQPGKYTSDGHWDPHAEDTQLGVVPMMARLVELDASLQVPGWPATQTADVPPTATPAPARVNGGEHGTSWLQTSLNTLGMEPAIAVDGSFGRQTRRAVLEFQRSRGLVADGLVGQATTAAIERALQAKGTAA